MSYFDKITQAMIGAVIGLSIAISYEIGGVMANRRTLRTAIEIVGKMEPPVNYLNAQDCIAVVAQAAEPRWRDHDPLEEYAPGKFINIEPRWNDHARNHPGYQWSRPRLK